MRATPHEMVRALTPDVERRIRDRVNNDRMSAYYARDVEALLYEIDLLRALLVSAEGYAIASGADLPFVSLFVEDSPSAAAIERAGCYPRDARREHPGPYTLNPPSDGECAVMCDNCGRTIEWEDAIEDARGYYCSPSHRDSGPRRTVR